VAVVNLPGSPGGVRDGIAVLDDMLAHVCALLRGERPDHGAGGGAALLPDVEASAEEEAP
jgi:hypothetical protein